ncbi:MAG TPA: DUF465 domain-containing protein [Alphaproteobacteria bacterium]|nr:DUF465 domain-containing protein [Alphaproteobacteria bacterium]
MTVQAHLESLSEQHSHLEQEITDEFHRPNPDSLKLTALKREKLRIKEEIDKLEH